MSTEKRYYRLFKILHSKPTQIVIGIIIAIDVISTIFSSFLNFKNWDYLSFLTTITAAIIFSTEYICRILSAPHLYPHTSALKARIRYIFSFFGIIDFIATLPFAAIFIFSDYYMDLFELSQIFLIFKLIRYSKSFHYISDVFKSVKDDLITVFVSMNIFMVFSATLMYYIEREAQPEVFENVGQGLWWAVITFTTIGYGDIYPITPLGKILGGIIGIMGIMIVAIPTGIISSAFVNFKIKNKT